jgi:hypothetical protein
LLPRREEVRTDPLVITISANDGCHLAPHDLRFASLNVVPVHDPTLIWGVKDRWTTSAFYRMVMIVP